jgi:diphthine synthase
MIESLFGQIISLQLKIQYNNKMTLYLVGLGLGDERDITVKGLEIVKKCKSVYLESYTSILGISRDKLVSKILNNTIVANTALVDLCRDLT